MDEIDVQEQLTCTNRAHVQALIKVTKYVREVTMYRTYMVLHIEAKLFGSWRMLTVALVLDVAWTLLDNCMTSIKLSIYLASKNSKGIIICCRTYVALKIS